MTTVIPTMATFGSSTVMQNDPTNNLLLSPPLETGEIENFGLDSRLNGNNVNSGAYLSVRMPIKEEVQSIMSSHGWAIPPTPSLQPEPSKEVATSMIPKGMATSTPAAPSGAAPVTTQTAVNYQQPLFTQQPPQLQTATIHTVPTSHLVQAYPGAPMTAPLVAPLTAPTPHPASVSPTVGAATAPEEEKQPAKKKRGVPHIYHDYSAVPDTLGFVRKSSITRPLFSGCFALV